ncbi:DUF2381 family protein [Archangium violaceum]|uniref:DUF2381 family protein n=1 Tax=Archangium violaceum TaxID=83451 RepID=UPI00193C30F8|nr:DUF2381 family protein [Archangium violaceum]QRK06715.1 DUF2381 family protein [Archangium violaceum]
MEAASACEDSRRIELSSPATAATREICVSPGIMTGFLFDTRVFLELQDEMRFVEVLRGRSGISFMPPRDMAIGERLRLTARSGDGSSEEIVTFTLVAHRGLATRQVEVYRDRRTRESYYQEAEQERANNQKLREELQRLWTQLEEKHGLRSLLASGLVDERGIRGTPAQKDGGPAPDTISYTKATFLRAKLFVVVWVSINNTTTTPWMATGASLIDSRGEELPGLILRHDAPIQPSESRPVYVEAGVSAWQAQGTMVLKLWDQRSRTVTIPGVVFPELEKTVREIHN